MSSTLLSFDHISEPVDPRQAIAERDLSRRVAADYRTEILKHMEDMDAASRPNPAMIETQPEIDWQIWPFLVDFMIDSHARLDLEPQTLFMAVNILNRYCALRIVYRKHLQLVGCTALWIAAKYEDKKSRVPSLATLSNMCCSVYQPIMFVQMEGHMLSTLDWSISHCTVDSFLSICLSHGASPLLSNLSMYLAELTLYIRPFIGVAPHKIARTIHLLALHILSFYPSLSSQSMSSAELECLRLLSEAIASPSRTVADKYSSTRRYQVTRLVSSYVMRSTAPEKIESHMDGQPVPFSHPNSQFVDFTFPPTPPKSEISMASSTAKSTPSSFCSAATPPRFSLNFPNASGSTTSVCSGPPQLPSEDSPIMTDFYRGDYSAPMSGVIDELARWDSDTYSGNVRGSPPLTPLVPPKMPSSRLRLI